MGVMRTPVSRVQFPNVTSSHFTAKVVYSFIRQASSEWAHSLLFGAAPKAEVGDKPGPNSVETAGVFRYGRFRRRHATHQDKRQSLLYPNT
jgi:hypothetical protein